MTKKEALYKYCLRIGDDALILGHRLSEWCSNGPILEEDLALTNLALDMIGRAQAVLTYAVEIKGDNVTADDLAYRRSEREYYNHLLVEQTNGDFAHTITRQLFLSVFELYFFEALQQSKDNTLAAIAAKTLKEVKYHVRHAADWAIRLGDGTTESKKRMQEAVNDLWMYTGELFETDEAEGLLLHEGLAVDLATIKATWQKHIKEVLGEATLHIPTDGYMQTGGLKGVHSEQLGHILSEMQYLQRAYPDAKW
jgi:ring-1,2-phenylacetyl-CoA epoxidase subunit PaaC